MVGAAIHQNTGRGRQEMGDASMEKGWNQRSLLKVHSGEECVEFQLKQQLCSSLQHEVTPSSDAVVLPAHGLDFQNASDSNSQGAKAGISHLHQLGSFCGWLTPSSPHLPPPSERAVNLDPSTSLCLNIPSLAS